MRNKKNKNYIIVSLFEILTDKKFLKEIGGFLFICAIILITIVTCVDLNTNDEGLSSDPVVKEENVQYEIRKNEAKFRDEIFKNIESFSRERNFKIIDSITENKANRNEFRNYVIINKLKSIKGKYNFIIQLDKATSPIVVLKQLNVEFEIDFNNLNNIILASNSGINEDTFKYGNYLKTNYVYFKKLRIDYLIIIIFLTIAIFVFAFFLNRIGLEEKVDNLKEKAEQLEDDKDLIKEAQKILDDENINSEEILVLKELFHRIENNLSSYKFKSILKSILYEDLIKSEKKSIELYNRSTLMLVLGLLVAVVGILVFYFTLPEFDKLKNPSEYLAHTIRPTIILIFIQSISFFLLKQYRSLIEDYKFFYNEYLKKSRFFTAHQLIKSSSFKDVEIKLIDSLLKNTYDHDTGPQNSDISSDNLTVIEMLKSVIEKLK